jgi:hypothetical protein
MLTLFNDLPDLSLIEIFSYLSCIDALWCFNNLNNRLTRLVIERGFYSHVNLSSTRYHRFKAFLSLLRFDEIQSLIIDCYSSPLQLKCWPFLPHLRILKLKGVRDMIDVFNFVKQHAITLTHLTVESSTYFETVSIVRNNLSSKSNALYRKDQQTLLSKVFFHVLDMYKSQDLLLSHDFCYSKFMEMRK